MHLWIVVLNQPPLAYEGQSGSKDRGDPEVSNRPRLIVSCLERVLFQTSNLFVANLPSNVTEQSLGQFFARHGPVGSVGPCFFTKLSHDLGHAFRSRSCGLAAMAAVALVVI